MKIEFKKEGEQIVGRLEVERVQVKEQIESAVNNMVAKLNESGVQVKSVEVVQSDFNSVANNNQGGAHYGGQWNQNSDGAKEGTLASTGYKNQPNELHASESNTQSWEASDKALNVLA